jgi:hypothetical protein
VFRHYFPCNRITPHGDLSISVEIDAYCKAAHLVHVLDALTRGSFPFISRPF